MRTLRPLLVCFVVLASLGACSSKSKSLNASCRPGPGQPEVSVVDNAFNPSSVCVKPGATVTWHFTGNQTHDVAGEGFHSELKREGSYSHRFVQAGKFEFRCTIHSSMRGTVQVANG